MRSQYIRYLGARLCKTQSSGSRGLESSAVLAGVLVLLVVGLARAQTQNAVVYGTMYDARDNAMPGVTVTLENAGLGFSRTSITDATGTYEFTEVPPAENYRLTASKGGRTLDVREGVDVNPADVRPILPPLSDQAGKALRLVDEAIEGLGGEAKLGALWIWRLKTLFHENT